MTGTYRRAKNKQGSSRKNLFEGKNDKKLVYVRKIRAFVANKHSESKGRCWSELRIIGLFTIYFKEIALC